MNILVINVALRPASPAKLFPVGLGYIVTAIKRAGYEFDLLDIDAQRPSDDEVEAFIKAKRYDVVCIGCLVTGYRILKSLATLVKANQPHCVLIAGNSVATSITETLLTKTPVDVAVMGEGDETIIDLLQAIEKRLPLEEVAGICLLRDREMIRTAPRRLIKDISSLPFVDFSLFDVETYIAGIRFSVNDPIPVARESVRALPVNTARGCVARCTFCYHVFKDVPYRHRSPESVVSEIKSLLKKYDLNFILFWDELTFFSKRQTLALVDRILDEKLEFYWSALCRGDLFTEEEDLAIMRKMKQAGCIGMGYSLESADPGILEAMNKRVSPEQFAKQTALYRRAGIPTLTSLVLGYPQETPETIRKTFEVCAENGIYPSAGYLLPQPGSVMYEYAREHGFIGDEEEYLLRLGDRQDLRLNMTSMSDEQLQNEVVEGLRRCNEALGLGLNDNQLIKTQYYRSSQKQRDEAFGPAAANSMAGTLENAKTLT